MTVMAAREVVAQQPPSDGRPERRRHPRPDRTRPGHPASAPGLVHVWSTCHRSRAVRNGLQRSPAVGRLRRLQAPSCGNRPGGRTLIRMRSQVQVLAVPPTVPAAHGHPPTSRSPRTQWCDDPHAGLNPRPDGNARNAREQGRPQSVKEVAMDIIGVIIAGIIIGLLGKFFAPGDRDNIPLWLTVVCGIGGVLIGYYLAAALGVEATRGIDWIRWIISIVVAAILVMIAASVTGRRGRAI